jgi:hypothetical protein
VFSALPITYKLRLLCNLINNFWKCKSLPQSIVLDSNIQVIYSFICLINLHVLFCCLWSFFFFIAKLNQASTLFIFLKRLSYIIFLCYLLKMKSIWITFLLSSIANAQTIILISDCECILSNSFFLVILWNKFINEKYIRGRNCQIK